jgi:hypothetical protein
MSEDTAQVFGLACIIPAGIALILFVVCYAQLCSQLRLSHAILWEQLGRPYLGFGGNRVALGQLLAWVSNREFRATQNSKTNALGERCRYAYVVLKVVALWMVTLIIVWKVWYNK